VQHDLQILAISEAKRGFILEVAVDSLIPYLISEISRTVNLRERFEACLLTVSAADVANPKAPCPVHRLRAAQRISAKDVNWRRGRKLVEAVNTLKADLSIRESFEPDSSVMTRSPENRRKASSQTMSTDVGIHID
jgi:hypothetical protein